MSYLRAILMVMGVGLCVLLVIPTQSVMLLIGGKAAEPLPYAFFWAVTRILRVKVQIRGRPSSAQPTLFVANHLSWLDICVLGQILTSSFVARADLATWRLFGYLSTLRRTIFIDRENRARSGTHMELMNKRLHDGDSLILFPEGTSSDGGRVLPFKSSLFAVAERWTGQEPLTVQPVSIFYTELNGMPMGRHFRPYVTWFGDMELGPHVWDLMRTGRVTAVVTFHPPVTIDQVGNRKDMSATCFNAIDGRVEELRKGYDHLEVAA